MTLTFNSKKYQELLLTYQPKIIRNEQENERALTIVERLMNRQQRSLEEDELYELLILLIENFEQKFYNKLDSKMASMIDFLMDQQDKTTEELATALYESLLPEQFNKCLFMIYYEAFHLKQTEIDDLLLTFRECF